MKCPALILSSSISNNAMQEKSEENANKEIDKKCDTETISIGMLAMGNQDGLPFLIDKTGQSGSMAL